MTKNQIARRVVELRNLGLSFRQIEARMPKTLGLSQGMTANGTKAFRIARKAA